MLFVILQILPLPLRHVKETNIIRTQSSDEQTTEEWTLIVIQRKEILIGVLYLSML